MKHLYKIIFLFVLINFNSPLAYSSNNIEKGIPIKTVANPSGQITGNATVCLNAAKPLITFEVKDENGKEPYTFTYTINGGTTLTIKTENSNKSITVSAPTDVAGTFTYVLTGVKDKEDKDVDFSINPVIITVIPNFTVNAGTDIIVCSGNTINLHPTPSGNGSQTVSYSWTGPNGFTSTQQSPSISNSSIAMSGDYTVTASIGSCSKQDVVRVDVAEPQITSGQFQNGILVKCTTSPSQTTGVINFMLTIPSYSSNIQNYTIDWGSGSPSTQVLNSSNWSNSILHTYNVGMHLISITINFTNGCSTIKQFNAFVGSSPAAATLVLNQNQANGCAPLTTTWTFTVPNNVDGTKYSGTWGETSTQDNFVYSQGGSVPTATSTMSWSLPSIDPVTLTTTYVITKTYLSSSCGINVVLGATTYYNTYQPIVITQNPCTNTPQPSGTGLVSVGKSPVASFAPTSFPPKICIGNPLQLTNTSNFGQTIPTSNGATCLTTGNFYWTITALTPVSPGAWTASGLGSNNGLTEADYDSWTNGAMTPTITFNEPGNYRITLFIANSCGGDSVYKDICVQSKVTPVFTLSSPLIGCVPLTVQATDNSVTSVSCSNITYQWNFNNTAICGTTPTVTYLNGTNANSQNPKLQFNNAGTYKISLTTTNDCGSLTSAIQTITVKQPPTVSINSIADFCLNQNTTPLANVASCLPTTSPSMTYLWTFTGGLPTTANTLTAPMVTYAIPGIYTVSLAVTNECGTTTVSSNSFLVKPNMTVTAASSSPTLCINTPLLPSITHTTTLATGIGSASGLPTGFTATWSSNTITISGTPTVSGAFNYSIPLTGGCGAVNATGTITVTPNMTVTAASSSPTLCINTPLSSSITHTTILATGISTASGLPPGVIAAWSSNTITISGTPTVSGTFNYTIPLTGGCGNVNATGTIIIKPNNTVTVGSSSPTLCINTPLSPSIKHTASGATGIGITSGLPAGVTAAWSSNTITISGTPTVSGTFNYSIPLTGGCGSVNATGTITVTLNMTVTIASSSPTLCINTVLSPNITHTTTSATGIGSASGLPTGVNATWSSNTITISGTPTVSGTFNYTIPLTGGCGAVNATGTITVTPNMSVTAASSSPTLCINTPLSSSITHTTISATGISTASGLPPGVIAAWSSNTITISGTPTVSGTFNYTIPLTGGCGNVNATGTIIVKPDNIAGIASSSPTLCINTALSPNITHTTT
ncbi:beta strand repeat-containing protein, partial [Flavobacterium sp. ZS1P70]